ncbi:polysaccharide pyruvyl transferase CsaB [Paenibacillus sp. UMB4589-SE434]|uniref:polysaccharide pyruvyl transferase CsaB n=1 Tax=Paenibacillus sp. UMB4589-SE434 TaxID=3046314 RepID=UPI00254E5AF2|nr:polysaccharide pyruvyl transferase CsaB [Paenibacillus sp. UMB4589-SE434]MDK8181610.1 polysaccharide pyruvyl transferase CsaB [Paenibacillus sp. UMB4589-SE434]
MASEVKTIVLSGYYGFNNSGDEAVLKSILTALERAGEAQGVRIEPVVLSGDPATTTKLYGVRAVHRMRIGEVWNAIRQSDGLISGGGSLLQDATSSKTIPYYIGVIKLAQLLRKPTFMYAQGIGPVQRKSFYPLIRHTFKRAAYVSVRDTESAELLVKMGLSREKIDVVPDPVMGLRLPEQAEQGSSVDESGLPYVGVSVRYWNADHTDLMRVAEMLKLVMKRHAVHLRFVPFHGQADEDASRFVMEQLGDISQFGSAASISPAYAYPVDMLAEVSRCQLLIGMRLHSLIYAASQKVPVLGISYDPKIDQFLHRLDEQAIGSTLKLDPVDAADEVLSVLHNLDAWRHNHHRAIERLIQEAERPAQQVVRMLRQYK